MRAVSPTKVQLGACNDWRCKSCSAHELVPAVWSGTFGSRVAGRAWVEDGQRAERVEEDSRNFEVLHPALVGVLRFQCGQSQVSGSVNSCHGNGNLLVGKMTQPGRLNWPRPCQTNGPTDKKPAHPCISCAFATICVQFVSCNQGEGSELLTFCFRCDSKKPFRVHA